MARATRKTKRTAKKQTAGEMMATEQPEYARRSTTPRTAARRAVVGPARDAKRARTVARGPKAAPSLASGRPARAAGTAARKPAAGTKRRGARKGASARRKSTRSE